jgi:uncharacterized protein (DUF427 family)
VSLTTGRGPLSGSPAGRFNLPVPEGLVYVEPFRRRVRAETGGRTVIDTERAVLVHRQGQPPSYAFPADQAGQVDSSPEPGLEGYVRVAWDTVEGWYEEDERVFMHPRNPYHRVDCLHTSRRLRVEVAEVVLVDTTDTVGVYETALEPRLYVTPGNVRRDLLRSSLTTTYCPYKGTASYWNAVVDGTVVDDVAWSYEDPLPESVAIRGLIAFDPARATVEQDVPSAALIG